MGECDLVDKVIEEQVPAHTCRDEAAETYLTVLRKEEQTTNIKNTCSATGGAVCRVSSSTDCTEVEWTECEGESSLTVTRSLSRSHTRSMTTSSGARSSIENITLVNLSGYKHCYYIRAFYLRQFSCLK